MRTLRALGAALLIGLPSAAVHAAPEGYYNAAQLETRLKELAGRYRAAARLVSYGKSHQKRDLWAVEVTDHAVGKPEEKPGVLLIAGLRGDEPGGSEVALRILQTVLERNGKDPAVTELLRTRTLYVVPRANPDGIERAFGKTAVLHPNTAEPLDSDGDEADSEDGPADVDGDGILLQMRLKDPEGEWRADEKDPRTLVRRKPGETGQYRLYPLEARDADGDGLVGEDGPGGTNLDRNFPALWEWRSKQPGAGPFGASAPETVALIEFLLARPNIGLVEVVHVTGAQPFLPATRHGAAYGGQDKAVLDAVGKKWEEATGNKLPVPQADPRDPGHGTFLDWAYLHFGALAVSPEVWSAPRPAGADKPAADAPTGEKAWLEWDQRENGGAGYVPWKPFKHPELGDVEIGGWKPFTRDNPPAARLDAIAEKETAFFLTWAGMSPLLKIAEVKVVPQAGGVWQVLMTVTNTGATPTASGQGVVNRQTRPVLAILDLPAGARLLSGVQRARAGHLQPGETKTIGWTLLAPAGTAIKLTANAQRAGQETREVVLR